ncbi:hypothetical protein QVD17_32270 [Tagetes erecta]|uniref:Mechanosensitive ion channel MscS domain-containing protein n=1 Tax=Tagetes erecta TaxID=13708 RepID=A0AAD8NPA9_TARER|nr:hypothetical protein QVD17_32270 [Tagetes erecta]
MFWLFILDVVTALFLKGSLLAVFLSLLLGGFFSRIFEVLYFWFVVHPYDVGDLCVINDVQMRVSKMYMSTTVFLRYDNHEITYPNSVLATMPIANYRRSPDMGEVIDFYIHSSTSYKMKAEMRERITSCVENMTEYWHTGPKIIERDVADLNRLKMSLCVLHRMNFQDMDERLKRRSLLVNEMIKIFEVLKIGSMLPMENNVGNLPAFDLKRFPSGWKVQAN